MSLAAKQENLFAERQRFGATETVTTESADETMALGRKLAGSIQAGDVVALFGEMGSGKTTFVRGVCSGLGVADDVSSPTFTLINEYGGGRLPVFHFDFYRIGADAAWELGCEEYFSGSGVCLLEWPERASDLLPRTRLDVHFATPANSGARTRRQIEVIRR